MKRLAIITTHPIQYNAPFFKQLAQSQKLQIKVFYTLGDTTKGYFDQKFQKQIAWDIPLLEAYQYTFVGNIATKPSTQKFFGIKNPKLIREIKQWQPNAIVIYGWRHFSHFSAMLYFKGKTPILFRGDSTLIDINSKFKLYIKTKILSIIYKFIDYTLYVGTNNKNYFKQCSLKDQQLIFVPHAVDNKRFEDTDGNYQQKANLWRKQLAIDNNQKTVLYVGKFEPIKNLFLLLNCAKKLPQTKFILVGNGSLEKQLKQSAPQNVIFLPFQNQSQMPIVYRLANIFALCSFSETWGLAINEAMACGLAIVASNNVGCAVDLVQNGINGYIFQNNNLDDLVGKISLALKNCQTLSQNSKQIIQNWNYNKGVEQIEKLLSNL